MSQEHPKIHLRFGPSGKSEVQIIAPDGTDLAPLLRPKSISVAWDDRCTVSIVVENVSVECDAYAPLLCYRDSEATQTDPWAEAAARYRELPVTADSLDMATAFVRRWFGRGGKYEQTDAHELARMFDAVRAELRSEIEAATQPDPWTPSGADAERGIDRCRSLPSGYAPADRAVEALRGLVEAATKLHTATYPEAGEPDIEAILGARGDYAMALRAAKEVLK